MPARPRFGTAVARAGVASDAPVPVGSAWLPSDRALVSGAIALAVAALAIWIATWLTLVHPSHARWIHVAFLGIGPGMLAVAWAIGGSVTLRIGRAELGRRFAIVPIAVASLALQEIAVAALGDEARWTCLPVFALASATGLLIGEWRHASERGFRWLPWGCLIGYVLLAATSVQTVLRPLDLSFGAASARAATPDRIGRFDDLRRRDPGGSVRTLLYGAPLAAPPRALPTRDSLASRSVDARPLLTGWNGFGGWLRGTYFGVAPEALPLAGRIWLPDESLPGPHPLIVVAHGNHPMETRSYEGFGYLCEDLARRGFLCVSTDMRFLNSSYLGDLSGGLQGDRLVRSWMLLEHLDQLRTWNETPGHPLHGLVATDEIGLVGHSRGGAVVVMAADLNERGAIPNWPGATLPAPFRIRSVTALAPIEIAPADRAGDGRLALAGTSYLVLHGSQDTDVHSFEGSLQYGRMDARAGDDALHASFHFAGGNHVQFNSEWGESDKPLLLAPLVDSREVMAARDQRNLTLAVLVRFLGAVHGRSEADRAWLREPRDLAARLGEGGLAHRYRDARSVALAVFDEDRDPSTATIPGGVVTARHFDIVREEHIERRWPDSLEISRSLRLVWKAESRPEAPHLALSFPVDAVTLAATDSLLLDLALDVHAAQAPDPISLDVELADDQGRRARTTLRGGGGPLSDGHAPLYHARIMNPRAEILPTTWSLRIADFDVIDPGFDPARLRDLRLFFDPTRPGALLIDGIVVQPTT